MDEESADETCGCSGYSDPPRCQVKSDLTPENRSCLIFLKEAILMDVPKKNRNETAKY